MVNERQQPPLSPVESYNAALQLHNNEFRTLGDRANTFLLTQSILFAALILILVNYGNVPIPLDITIMGIILLGILFCMLYIRAGRSGAYAAYGWRKYLLHLENKHPDAPWNWFSEYFENKTKKAKEANRCITKFYREHLWWITDEGHLAKCLPLPSSWLFSTSAFLVVWTVATAYTYKYLDAHTTQSLRIPFVVIAGIFIILAVVLICQAWKAWQKP